MTSISNLVVQLHSDKITRKGTIELFHHLNESAEFRAAAHDYGRLAEGTEEERKENCLSSIRIFLNETEPPAGPPYEAPDVVAAPEVAKRFPRKSSWGKWAALTNHMLANANSGGGAHITPVLRDRLAAIEGLWGLRRFAVL